jgi:pimeloyl-ACP methyl ester carboxylesterase
MGSPIHSKFHIGNYKIKINPFFGSTKVKSYTDHIEIFRALRNMKDIDWPQDLTIQVPVLLIQGERDCSCRHPSRYQAMKEGVMYKYVRDLEITSIPEGCHFVQEQFPDQVNQLIVSFIKGHPVNA